MIVFRFLKELFRVLCLAQQVRLMRLFKRIPDNPIVK